MSRIGCALVAIVLCAAIVPAAEASTVYVTRIDEGSQDWLTLHVESNSRKRNRLSVAADGASFVIRDPRERLRATRRAACDRIGDRALRCSRFDGIALDLGPGNDVGAITAQSSSQGVPEAEIHGGPGDDRLRIGYGGRIDGGRDSDTISVGARPFARSSYLYGGPGSDEVRGGRGSDVLAGGEGDDDLHGGGRRDELYGGNYVDPLEGPAGQDRMHGGRGDDRFDDNDRTPPSRIGPDRLIGGVGDDFVSYRAAHQPVLVNLSEPGGDGQRGEGDHVSRMEEILGGDGDDRLIGDRDANTIEGGPGDDFVRGRAGDDRLVAADRDRVAGQSGDDRIAVLDTATRFSCGRDEDTAVRSGTPDSGEPGVLVPVSCERLAPDRWVGGGSARSVVITPTPELTGEGELRFRLFAFLCCEQRLVVTEPEPPYEELGSAQLNSDLVTVPLPPETAERARQEVVPLRATVFSEDGSERLVWRFELFPD